LNIFHNVSPLGSMHFELVMHKLTYSVANFF
jgi:hypothetical protein